VPAPCDSRRRRRLPDAGCCLAPLRPQIRPRGTRRLLHAVGPSPCGSDDDEERERGVLPFLPAGSRGDGGGGEVQLLPPGIR